MKKNARNFVWSDNWWVEDNKAWFVSGDHNILFCNDLVSGKCQAMACIPTDSKLKFRQNPFCIKRKSNVYCVPDIGNSIWIYDIEKNSFCDLLCNNPKNVRLSIGGFWLYNDKIFAVSIGLKKIIEIDTQKKKIENYYTVSEDEKIAGSVMVDGIIYIISRLGNKIFAFDIEERKTNIYQIPGRQKKVHAMCYIDGAFWISGYRKEIYVWNIENNTIKTIKEFPSGFGVYNFNNYMGGSLDCKKNKYELPTFWYAVAAGDYVWFIPLRTNRIIYVDRMTYNIHFFEIPEEEETEESLQNWMFIWCKYLLEYVREERYLVLFSMKKQCILEIDMLEMRYTYKHYSIQLNDKFINGYIKYYGEIPSFYEGSMLDMEIFTKLIEFESSDKHGTNRENIGALIHEEMLMNS